MSTYMVVASFDPDTDLPKMNDVLAAEIARVKELREANLLGSLHIAAAQGRVFAEVFAEDAATAEGIVQSLPMSAWWRLEVFATTGPKTSV